MSNKDRYIITEFEHYKKYARFRVDEKFRLNMPSLFFYDFDDLQKDIITFAKNSNHNCLVSIDAEDDSCSEIHIVENDEEICDYLVKDDGEEFHIFDKIANKIVAHFATVYELLKFIKVTLQSKWTLTK